MKCQILLSRKNKKNIISLSSADFAHSIFKIHDFFFFFSFQKKHRVEPILYMTEWFMCVFSRTLPWACVLRVWDMFFCEGKIYSFFQFS